MKEIRQHSGCQDPRSSRGHGAHAVALRMLTQRHGSIISISSLAARVGCEGRVAYSSSKGGVRTPLRRPCPPDMEKAWDTQEKSTPVKARIPLHRLAMPLEIADQVLILASPASDFICGQVLFIDGGDGAV